MPEKMITNGAKAHAGQRSRAYRCGVLAAGATLLVSGAARAQQDGPPEMIKGAATERLMADAAACLVRGERVRAVAVIRTEPRSPAESQAVVALLNKGIFCFGSQTITKAPLVTWRGALAEALYLRSFRADAGQAAAAATVDTPQWLQTPRLADYAIAQCAAQRDTVAADRLVRAKWRSEEETRAVNAFLPILKACSYGRRAQFDRVTIHGLVAESLFRMRGGDVVGGER